MLNEQLNMLGLVELTSDEAGRIDGGWFRIRTMEDLAYWAWYSRR